MPLEKKKSQPHVQAHLALRASAPKELSPPTTLLSISNILYHEIRYIKSKLLIWCF